MLKPARITTTIENVGTGWSTVEISTPAEFVINRARANISSGDGTTVALRVSETSAASGTDVVLEYSLTTNPLDSTESIYFRTSSRNKDNKELGKTWVSVKCDSGTSAVEVKIDIDRK
jgi:hypothetical protein